MTYQTRDATQVQHTDDPPLVARLARSRGVRASVCAWAGVNALLLGIAGDHLPFHASELADPPAVMTVLQTNAMFLEVFALMLVVHLLTRHRVPPDLAARAPVHSQAIRETVGLLGYGVAAMTVGYLVTTALGWHAFSFHLDGMVIRTDQEVVPAEAICWAAYNLVVYAVAPLWFFRRRYSGEQLGLHSSDLRADLRIILVVLVVESTLQLSLDHAVLDLDARQLALGTPVTFVLSFAGTVLPTMVFVFCILTPRYLRITGSAASTVALGGLTYAALHVLDGWTSLASPTDITLSVLYVLLFYTAPGMFKTFLTLRTGNAWVHVWAYHAIAPHTLIDTPMFVKVFGIR
ncbi:MAG: hypothetical protein KDB43_12835 [Nocardioidaceae bacterium]|nr:hypothetical protein [Nocardioidaceae bacterium]